MAFGFAGAAAGASDALQQMLAERHAQMVQQQQLQMAQEQAQRQGAQFDANLGMQNQRLQLDQQQHTDDQAFRAGQQARQAQQDEMAATEQRQVGNQQGVRRMIGDFLVQRGSQPLDAGSRQTLQGMAIQEDVDLPNSITADPNAELAEYEAKRKIDLKHRPPSATSDDLVKVDTVENGKRVTKWLPKAQVAGQTFESPSGGPTLASGQQRRIMNFYNRMKDASEVVSAIEPDIAKAGLLERGQLQYAPNIAQTPQQQSYRQAQRAFTEARLRKESGAAIPPHEYEADANTYFAQPGDDDATLQQKQAARQTVLESTAFEAGPAFEEFYGEPFQRNSVNVNPATRGGANINAPGGQEFDFVPGRGLVPRGAR